MNWHPIWKNQRTSLQRRSTRHALAAGLALAVAIPLGCLSARREEIPEQDFKHNPQLAEGRRVFMQNCNECHVHGEGGVGPSLNNHARLPMFIKYQVRHGLGSMPSFTQKEISDKELDALAEYVVQLRHQPIAASGN